MFGGLEDSLRTRLSTKSSWAGLWPKTVAYKLRTNARKELTCHPLWHIQKIKLGNGKISTKFDGLPFRKPCVVAPGEHLATTCTGAASRNNMLSSQGWTLGRGARMLRNSVVFHTRSNLGRSLACRIVKELSFILEG